ncbi:MAG TPA: hypothetical protein EYO90_09210, partial [Candidatus Latescibacteria bacterium]|nr:hypothetical protein [Candidatus Latescibacterota bacterium]
VERPNVIYILGDDHRVAQQGGMGHLNLQTPNLDALAKAGVQFTHAFCTSPACTPRRTSQRAMGAKTGDQFQQRIQSGSRCVGKKLPHAAQERRLVSRLGRQEPSTRRRWPAGIR